VFHNGNEFLDGSFATNTKSSGMHNRGSNHPNIKDHRIKMNKILKGHQSPYSILSNATPEEFNTERSYLQSISGGQRTTRAAAMRHMHLKKMFDPSRFAW